MRTQFLSAPGYDECHYAVQPHGSEEGRQHAEAGGQEGDQPLGQQYSSN